MTELLPCKNCGWRPALLSIKYDDRTDTAYRCLNCTINSYSPEEAAAIKWNEAQK